MSGVALDCLSFASKPGNRLLGAIRLSHLRYGLFLLGLGLITDRPVSQAALTKERLDSVV